MSEIISGILKKDITIKIISVMIAIILWYNVLDKNTNPVEDKVINIPLKILNESSLADKNIGLKNRDFPNTIKVTVKGRKDKIVLLGPNDFQAQIDMGNIKSAIDKELPVNVIYAKGDFTVVTNPETVALSLENIIQNSFKVEVNKTGSLSKYYKIIKETVEPKTVTLKGYESIIKNISKVQVTVNVDKLDRDFSDEVACKFFSSNGQEYTAYKNNIPVNVKLEVAKEVSVNAVVNGTPAKNFINTENKVTPSKVYIVGPPKLLNGINELITEPVDIENKSSNVEARCRLKIPEGIKIYDAPDNIIVNALIEQVGRVDFDIPKEDIEILNPEIDNTLNYDIQTPAIKITLKGKANVLKKINIRSLKPNIDVSNLTEGTYTLPLNLNLPSGVRPVESYEIEVRIDKR